MRDLMGRPAGDDPAARTYPVPPQQPSRRFDDLRADGFPGDAAPADRPASSRAVGAAAWLPGIDFERQLPRHAVSAGGWRQRLRWDPGRKGAAALGVAVIATVAGVGWWLAGSRPHEVPVPASVGRTASATSSVSSAPTGSASTGPPAGAASVAASGAPVVVDVAGKVRHPGIYTLPSGARVYDALRAAGGARSGVSTLPLNLAATVHDGQQIVVGVPAPPGSSGDAATSSGDGAAGTAPGGPATGGPTASVDLNTATLEQLETLPGVGPVMGQHILDWRSAHGQFTSIDQLQDVSGIGPAKFAAMKDLVTT